MEGDSETGESLQRTQAAQAASDWWQNPIWRRFYVCQLEHNNLYAHAGSGQVRSDTGLDQIVVHPLQRLLIALAAERTPPPAVHMNIDKAGHDDPMTMVDAATGKVAGETAYFPLFHP